MDKNSYALGMSIAHNMMSSGIRSIEFDDLLQDSRQSSQARNQQFHFRRQVSFLTNTLLKSRLRSRQR